MTYPTAVKITVVVRNISKWPGFKVILLALSYNSLYVLISLTEGSNWFYLRNGIKSLRLVYTEE